MSNFNLSMIDGYLTKDPKIATVSNGRAFCQFTIGNNKNYKNKEGKWVKEVHFFDITAWENLAKKCNNLKKGNRVFVSGRLKRYDWKNEEGKSKVKYYIEGKEINFFDKQPKL